MRLASLWDFLFFCRCKICLWEFMLFSCIIILCDFMLFGCYEISIWDFWALREISWFWDRFEISCFMTPTRFPCANFCCLLLNFLMRFHAFLFFMRFPYEIVCVLHVHFSHEISFWNFMLSAAQFSCKMSKFDFTLFSSVMRFLCEIYAF